MIVINVKIKADGRSYTKQEFIQDDNYNISKTNEDLRRRVEKACEESHIDDIQQVLMTAKMEW